MMRLFLAGILLLVGCAAKTKTPPRVVKIFENSSYKKVNLWSDECSWETVTLSVFNQDAQTIKFETQSCQNEPTNFYVKNGRDVFVSVKINHQDVNIVDEDMLVLSIWKTGPLTDEDFIKSLIPKTEETEIACQAIRDENNSWRIGLPEVLQGDGFGGSRVLYPPLPKYSAEICGPYSYNGGTMMSIGISDGIAIAYSDALRRVGVFDLNSITYENKG